MVTYIRNCDLVSRLQDLTASGAVSRADLAVIVEELDKRSGMDGYICTVERGTIYPTSTELPIVGRIWTTDYSWGDVVREIVGEKLPTREGESNKDRDSRIAIIGNALELATTDDSNGVITATQKHKTTIIAKFNAAQGSGLDGTMAMGGAMMMGVAAGRAGMTSECGLLWGDLALALRELHEEMSAGGITYPKQLIDAARSAAEHASRVTDVLRKDRDLFEMGKEELTNAYHLKCSLRRIREILSDVKRGEQLQGAYPEILTRLSGAIRARSDIWIGPNSSYAARIATARLADQARVGAQMAASEAVRMGAFNRAIATVGTKAEPMAAKAAGLGPAGLSARALVIGGAIVATLAVGAYYFLSRDDEPKK